MDMKQMEELKFRLSTLRRRKPFVPIRITLVDGRSFRIEDPFLYGLGMTTMIIGFEAGGHEQIKLENVASVEELQPAA